MISLHAESAPRRSLNFFANRSLAFASRLSQDMYTHPAILLYEGAARLAIAEHPNCLWRRALLFQQQQYSTTTTRTTGSDARPFRRLHLGLVISLDHPQPHKPRTGSSASPAAEEVVRPAHSLTTTPQSPSIAVGDHPRWRQTTAAVEKKRVEVVAAASSPSVEGAGTGSTFAAAVVDVDVGVGVAAAAAAAAPWSG